MTIAIQGIGKMGMQIAQKLISDNHKVIAYDLSTQLLDEARSIGAMVAESKQSLLEQFGSERIVLWIMIPSEYVKTEISDWLQLLPKNSIIIDGGNSNFKDTIENAATIESAELTMVDVGTSGGVHGLKNGFAMMVGSNNR